MSERVLVVGAGRIGALVGAMLAETGDFRVTLADVDAQAAAAAAPGIAGLDATGLDATDAGALTGWLRDQRADAVVACLPWFANPPVAAAARDTGTAYFDLTEDLESLRAVREFAAHADTAFVPACGLAPGFVSIAAADLVRRFETVDQVRLRVGALPAHPGNALKYALTWSTDGLINEYANPCPAIVDGRAVELRPLEGLESLVIDGVHYEAFNTSGGLGTLDESLAGRVRRLDYKTLRYPGHCALVKFLMHDLRLAEERDTLKRVLERALPSTGDDVVVLYAAASGVQDGRLREHALVRHIRPRTIAGRRRTAIQAATAAAACAVVDLVLAAPGTYRGFVRHEAIALETFLGNRFAECYTDTT